MTVEARIRVHHRGCSTEKTHGATTVTQLSNDSHTSIFLVTGETLADVDGMLRSLEDSLSGYTLLCRSPKVAMVRGGCPPSGVEECILSYGCPIIWPALFSDGRELYTIVAPSRERVKQLLERLQDFGGANLEAVSDVGPESLQISLNLADIAGVLTKRQLTILTTAVKAGYYRSPRRTTTERLAGAFGLSRTTLEEHLRKAESKVLQGVMEILGSHPMVAAVVREGGGRFPAPRAG